MLPVVVRRKRLLNNGFSAYRIIVTQASILGNKAPIVTNAVQGRSLAKVGEQESFESLMVGASLRMQGYTPSGWQS